MGLGPLRGRFAAGEAAAAVSGGHGEALSGGEQAVSGADAGDGPDLVEDDGDDLRSAVEPEQGFSGGEDDAVAGGGGALPGRRGVLAEGEHDGGGEAAGVREQFGPGEEFHGVQEAVVLTLPYRAGVLHPVLFGLGSAGGVQDGAEPFGELGGALELPMAGAVRADLQPQAAVLTD